jgi:hypothetical protein
MASARDFRQRIYHPAPPDGGGEQQTSIQVNSTIDADIVLRRIIEDRAAIIALKSREATNEAELLKARTRQLQIMKTLDRQDRGIAELIQKAKIEVSEYNEASKQYIRSFMVAFEDGDMDKLPSHPFVPPLEKLEEAIDRRKATLIEKVQADDRTKRLEVIRSQDRVTMEVMRKNEEAFMRAIELSKSQFSKACGTWLNHVNRLLSTAPRHLSTPEDINGSNTMDVESQRSHESELPNFRWHETDVKANPTPTRVAYNDNGNYHPIHNQGHNYEQQKDRVQTFDSTFKFSFPPPLDSSVALKPRNRRVFARDINRASAEISPERPVKRSIENHAQACMGHPREEKDDTFSIASAHSHGSGNKRQKKAAESSPHVSPVTTSHDNGKELDELAPVCHGRVPPHRSPNAATSNGSKVADAQDGEEGLLKRGIADLEIVNKSSTSRHDASSEAMKEEMSVAQVLTGLHEEDVNVFSVPNI